MMGKNEEAGLVKNTNGYFFIIIIINNINFMYLSNTDEDLKLYPIPLSIENLDMPYLTPDKH
jgi:hypothetical protein